MVCGCRETSPKFVLTLFRTGSHWASVPLLFFRHVHGQVTSTLQWETQGGPVPAVRRSILRLRGEVVGGNKTPIYQSRSGFPMNLCWALIQKLSRSQHSYNGSHVPRTYPAVPTPDSQTFSPSVCLTAHFAYLLFLEQAKSTLRGWASAVSLTLKALPLIYPCGLLPYPLGRCLIII